MNRHLLKGLCDYLQSLVIGSKKITLFIGEKPENYHFPAMHIGTTKSIPTEIRNAYFVEIFVNDRCIFRESAPIREGDDLQKTENYLIERITNNVFCYGVMTSAREINERPY